MTITLSNATLSGLREKADADLIPMILTWAKEQIEWALDTKDEEELKGRIQRIVTYGRRQGLQSQRELALLFGAMCAVGPRLASDKRFRASLAQLNETQRMAFLYDLLTGALHPALGEDLKNAKPDWSQPFQ